jgi:hypothetical protein
MMNAKLKVNYEDKEIKISKKIRQTKNALQNVKKRESS